ncbi:MAG: hypothetical protein IKL52_06675 [Candidatus Gastranaerophilales bacterium]|nr:hypothetical protein [Candidatus Gastranaerophilales bacterium]
MSRIIFIAFLFIFLAPFRLFANELPYNYESTFSVPIKLIVLDEVSTKEGIIEGEKIKLKVASNIYYKNQLFIKKGTIATARIETYLTKGMNGFPAEIMLDNFELEGIKTSQLLCNYTKKGFSLAYLVYPIKWALTPIPPTGSLTNFIKGFNATIKSGDIITIQYFPNWK